FLQISASVSDTAGVNSVIARIAHQYEISLTRSGSTFTGTFDTRLLANTNVFPLVEIVALDGVGNEDGVGRVVTLDNRPPLVSLGPPRAREARCMEGYACPPAGDPFECSATFDPVGDDAASDGETVAQLAELRARVEDQGNGPKTLSSGVFIPHAGVDPGAVQLFVLDAQALPLLVDLDGDTICDDVNPAISPSAFPMASDEAAVASLVALEPAGAAYFSDPIGPVGGDATIADAACLPALSPEADPPEALCPITTPATIIMAGLDDTPAIYS